MNIFFRVEANQNIGYGHLYRCLHFSAGLLNINNKLNFFFLLESITKDEKQIFKNFKNTKILTLKENYNFTKNDENIEILKLIKYYKPVILIVDSYNKNFNWEKKYYNHVKILAIDDLANRKHFSHYLLDYSLNRDNCNYSKLINKNSFNFLGSDFFLYNQNINYYRKKSFNNQILCKTSTCTINFGGADNNYLLFNIVKNILHYKIFKNIFFYLVVGHNQDLYLKINSLLKNYLSRKQNFKLLKNVKNMSKIYSISDFAIGAAGVSAYERLILGIPSIQIKAYNNQEYNHNEFFNSNLIIKLDNFSKKSLLNSFNSLKNKKYKIFKLSFSLYCKDTYLFIYNLLFNNKNLYSNYVSIKPISSRDLNFLFHLQNKENARKYFKKKSKISSSEHKKWFKTKFNDNKVIIFKICLGNLSIGYFKLENKINETYDISILIDSDFQKKGFAKKVLKKIKIIMSDKKLIAEVHKKNIFSKKLFINSGFKLEKSKNNFDLLSIENAKN